LAKVKLAISTVPDFETNLLLLEHIREINPKAVVVTRAEAIDQAFKLYKKGASYVLTPHFLGGEYVGKMIRYSGLDKKDYGQERIKHIKMLKEIRSKGQNHPEVERN
jgi:nicotinamide mononucleotide adenylyltransferase